jgi:hypothetical protein
VMQAGFSGFNECSFRYFNFDFNCDVNVHKMSESYRAYEIWKTSTVFFPENTVLVGNVLL